MIPLGGQVSSPENLTGLITDLKVNELLVADLLTRQVVAAVHLPGRSTQQCPLGQLPHLHFCSQVI